MKQRCSNIRYLSNKLNNFDKDVKRRVPGHYSLGALREEGVDYAGETGVRGRVALTLDADHVHPQQSVQRFWSEKQ